MKRGRGGGGGEGGREKNGILKRLSFVHDLKLRSFSG